MITGINESNRLTKGISSECKCKFDGTKFKLNTAFIFKRIRTFYGVCIVINSRSVIANVGIKKRIIKLIPVITPKTACCFSVIFAVLKQILHRDHKV